MTSARLAALPLALLPVALLAAAPDTKAPPRYIAAAVANPGRSSEDTTRDAERKPAEMLAFAQVKRGETIVDFMPGKGYFTRLFSDAIGLRGSVYAVWPQAVLDQFKAKGFPAPRSITSETGHGNVLT
jgi:predicted methyltransferase